MNRIILLLWSCLVAIDISFAQGTATISGRITDSSTEETIPGATIRLPGTLLGAIADLDGVFSITNIPEGHYNIEVRFVGYDSIRVYDQYFKGGEVIKRDFKMIASKRALKEVNITAVRVTHSDNAVINEMKKADMVISAIAAQQISKSQDRDAADVVKRIPGVTVMDNRFIVIRGLNERYNDVWLNNAGAPSSETDKKAFSFDVIPSGLIDRIMIYKTVAPELPGDFAGGMVKVFTRSVPDKSSLAVNLQSSVRSGTTFQPFEQSQKSKTDYLGYDNGFRDIPKGTPAYIGRNDTDIAGISKAFKNTWGLKKSDAAPDMRFSVYYMQPVHLKNALISNVSGISYSNSNIKYVSHRQSWDSTALASDYTDTVFTNQVRLSVLENIAVLYKNQKIEFRNLFNQSGRSQAVVRNSNMLDAANERFYLEGYQEKSTLSSQISGTHGLDESPTQYLWTLGYASSEKNDPDLKRIKYTKARTQNDTMFKAPVANVVDPVNGGGRFYSKLNEKVYSFNHSIRQKMTVFNCSFDVNAGNYIEYKDRSFAARVLGYTIKPGAATQILTRLRIDSIFDSSNMCMRTDSTRGFYMDEITSPSDKYNAQNELIASFVALNIPVGALFKVTGGVRHEFNIQSLQSKVNLDSISPKVTTSFFLPSVNASYNIDENSLFRIAYGKTLNRPEFREWSPFYFYDFDLGAGTYGSLFPTVLNPKGKVLNVAKIDNYDVRYEFYPSRGEYIHIGAFYKSFIDPIQQVILSSGGSDSKAFSFINAKSASSEGLELDVRKTIFVLFNTNASDPSANKVGVVANISLAKSKMNLGHLVSDSVYNASNNPDSAFKTIKSPLQGQSPYVVNLGLYYQNDSAGIDVTLLYNVLGPRTYLIGTFDIPNIVEMPRHTLDLSASFKVKKKLAVTLGAQDILNSAYTLMEDTNRNGKIETNGADKEFLTYRRGPVFTLGVKMEL